MTLLHVVQLPRTGVTGTPLFVEIPVSPETAPYIVTSNRGLMWIESPLKDGVVRSALVRGSWKKDIFARYKDVVLAVIRRGKEQSWGNAFPGPYEGSDGEDAASEYLKSLGLEEVEALDHDTKPRVQGVLHARNTWIPEGCGVVVPRDRSYLGIVGVWDDNTYTVVVHNPARGLAVIGEW